MVYEYASIVVNFYDGDIVEMMIFLHGKEFPVHYLHFQLDEEEQAKKLFEQMMDI